MIDYTGLMALLSVPRPNGSAAKAATRAGLAGWLAARGLPCREQSFPLYPFFFEAIGAWFILSRGLLALAAWLRWGPPSVPLLLSLAAVLGGTLDKVWHLPLVTWPGRATGQNLLLSFEPDGAGAVQELVLAAHYDSKTELLDHEQRLFFLRRLPLGLGLTLAVGLLAGADGILRSQAPGWADAAYVLAAILTLPMLFLGWGTGAYLALGRLAPPSQGAVDNGAACAVLLGLAAGLGQGAIRLRRTRVTVALFDGEEANMQGSRAYVAARSWPLPAAAVNLEILGQDGGYLVFARDGDAVRWRATDPGLNRGLAAAVAAVTGQAPQEAPALNSDGYSFLAAGIPTAVLGSYDRRLLARGLHTKADNLARVDLARLPEAVRILGAFLAAYDSA